MGRLLARLDGSGDWVKLAIAAAALAVMLAGMWWRRGGLLSRGADRVETATLLALGALALLVYADFGGFHARGVNGAGYVHLWDTFHHVLGAKYGGELGYDGLYACVAVADAEDGVPVGDRPLTDLRTNALGTAAESVAHPERCLARFAPERWAQFRRDVGFFRRRFPPVSWAQAQTDHGFNASPAWRLVAKPLVGSAPLRWRRVVGLTLLDPALLLVALAMVGWAFGWRSAALAAVVIGTYFPGRFWWTGGAFLRWDWLAALLAGLALCRRGWPAAGGALLGFAAMSRLFPIFALIGPAMSAVAAVARRKRVGGEVRRLLAGALVTAAVLVPVSQLSSAPHGWGEFAANLQKHSARASGNRMGLPVVLSSTADAPARPAAVGADERTRWEAAQSEVLAGRRWLWVAAAAAAFAGVWWAIRDEPAWATCLLGLLLVPFGPALACYYYLFVAALALLLERRRDTAAVLLTLVCSATVVALSPRSVPAQYAAQSWLVVAASALLITSFWSRPRQGDVSPAARSAGPSVAAAPSAAESMAPSASADASSPQVSGTGPDPSMATHPE